MNRLHRSRTAAAGTAIACAIAALGILLLPVPRAVAQSGTPSDLANCPAPEGARVRPATYVALGDGVLLRLLVERSVDEALLIMNKVEGNRLYDRSYWKPVKIARNCGQRTIDYVDPDARPGDAAQTLRLLLDPAEEVRRPGLPRPMVMFMGAVVLPSGERQPLQFEEVVIKREVGAGR